MALGMRQWLGLAAWRFALVALWLVPPRPS